MDLRNRTILITGAAQGLGLGIARRLAAAGARTVLVDCDPVVKDHLVEPIFAKSAIALVRDLAELLRAMTATNVARNRLRVEYELYLVAIRSEYLRPVSASWDAILRDALQAVVGETKARAIYAMVNGLLVEAVIHDRVLDKAEVAVLLSHFDRA